ncbi:sodium channel protein type 9 subunit alpha-like [Gracilinanus agilis]|uniref:sodium channel protein type 9 subunit alpha-like n=1 Tax=Gracilinanus agilis TaxID=191870 RepID=UPI001CFF1AC8|nr:sodium channel protein type 9 subunit alpha-like [Gracilinanus agilis]
MARLQNLTYFTKKSLALAEERAAARKNDEEGLEPDSDFEAGKKLPFIYDNVPPGMVSEPLEDLDPYYLDKNTFIVLNKGKTIFRFSASPAMYFLTPFHIIRRLSIKILMNRLFNMILMGTYLVNCIFLTAINIPYWIVYIELPFIGLYTFEILIKILARGFCMRPFTFLRDPWNWLDVHILVYACLTLLIDIEGVPAIGIFSVVRILKAVSLTRGTKIIIGTFTQSVRMFCHAVILTVFCLSVFAVMGMQLFMGRLKQKCVQWPQEQNSTEVLSGNETLGRYHLEEQMNALLCGNSSYSGRCPEGYRCIKTGGNPDYGFTNFDSFGWAFLSLFRLMTLDFWENLYQETLRTSGKASVIFFVVVIFFCSFYLVSLKLAVVAIGYEKQNRATIKAAKRRQVKYQAMLCRHKKDQEEIEAMTAVGADEKKKNGKDQGSADASSGISHHANERMEQRRKENQEKPTEREEKEIDTKLHQFESEDFIRKKVFHHGINTKRQMHKTAPFTEQGGSLQADKKERQINTCQVSMGMLEDPNVGKRSMSTTNILNSSEGLDKCRPRRLWKRFAKMFLIWDCCPFWLKCKDFVYSIVMDPFFDLAIAICVIMNLVFLAMYHYPMTEEFFSVLSVGELVFVGIYILEMVLKIIALHPYNYFQDKWNIFDSFIVTLALGELMLSILDGVYFSFLQFLILLRGLRVFKLTKYWPTMKMMINILGYSMKVLRSLIFILVIAIFIFAVIGLKFFRNIPNVVLCKIDVDCFPRWHMYDFLRSFLIVFRALYGEWIETMWDCMEMAGQPMCIILYMGIIVIGNLLVLILFVALVSSFISENSAMSDAKADSQNLHLAIGRIKRGIHYVKRTLFDLIGEVFPKKQTISKETQREENLRMKKKNGTSSQSVNKMSNEQDFQNDKEGTSASGSNMEKYLRDNNSSQSSLHNPSLLVPAPIALTEFDSENVNTNEFRNELDVDGSNEKLSQAISPEDSMIPILGPEEEVLTESEKSDEPGPCFSDGCIQWFPFCGTSVKSKRGRIWWSLRKSCYWIVKHHCFEMFMFLIILLSCGTLTFEDIYLEERMIIKSILEYTDNIFTYIFIIEMLLKWLAYGCKGYFSNIWCWLEFLVVNVCFFSLLSNYLGYSEFAALKSLRTLRILSVFKRVRVVLNTLVREIPSILKVLLVGLTFWLIFNIIGVNLFAGKFYGCINTTAGKILSMDDDVQDKSECEMLMYNSKDMVLRNTSGDVQWKNAKMNFDNVKNGYLSLFQIATFKGWLDILYSAVDSTYVRKSPRYEYSFYTVFYFIGFIIFGVFFPLVLFIGVIIDNLKQQKKIRGESIFMTEEQKKSYNSKKNPTYKNPIPRPRNKFQGYIFDLVTKEAFEITILVLICLNVMIMMMETDSDGDYKNRILYLIDLVFIVLFAGECVLKLIGLRHHYFSTGWNIFDFVVVHISIAVVLLNDLTEKYFLTYGEMQVIRFIRCGRVLKFFKGTKGIGTLISAMMLSLPALLNIVLLLFLVMIIYAIIGMSKFAFVKKEAGIDDMFNFETFVNSMLCLFQITTFAGWDGLLIPILNTGPPDCDPEKTHPGNLIKGDCGHPSFGVFYFVSYLIISFLLFVNMFLVVIFEIFSAVSEEDTKSLSEEAFDNFYEVWQKFDPDTTHFIDYSQLSDFAASLEPPLLISKPNTMQLMAMDLPLAKGDRVFCPDVLFALAKRVKSESEEFDHLHLPMREQFLSSCLFQISYEPVSTIKQKHEEVSAPVIAHALKEHESDTYGNKNGDREDSTFKDNVIFDRVNENSALEKAGDVSHSPTLIASLNNMIEKERDNHETNQTEKEDNVKGDREKEK